MPKPDAKVERLQENNLLDQNILLDCDNGESSYRIEGVKFSMFEGTHFYGTITKRSLVGNWLNLTITGESLPSGTAVDGVMNMELYVGIKDSRYYLSYEKAEVYSNECKRTGI
jgi:hypothetical protein